MNGSSSIETAATGPRMLAILAAAAAIGWAFNSMSPLGVRADTAANRADAPATVAPADIYENQSTAVTLGSASSAGRRAPDAPGGIYENETVGTRLETGAPGNPSPLSAGLRTITWSETEKLLTAGRIVLVDARDANYYQTGHIPGAVSLPTGEATPQALKAFAARYPRHTPLVVYCGSAKCPLSRQLIALFTGSMGYTDVRDMSGGFVEYREAQEQPAAAR
jgi:rhodanese-related sulfurtransferase